MRNSKKLQTTQTSITDAKDERFQGRSNFDGAMRWAANRDGTFSSRARLEYIARVRGIDPRWIDETEKKTLRQVVAEHFQHELNRCR
jgi:hypothetical protein